MKIETIKLADLEFCVRCDEPWDRKEMIYIPRKGYYCPECAKWALSRFLNIWTSAGESPRVEK